jgi:hypothetical protein
MLRIKNISSLKEKYIGHWKIHYVAKLQNSYLIKVVHNGSPFDMFNLMIGRVKTSNGGYLMYCQETGKALDSMPIEDIRDRDTFIRFLIDELI